MDVIVPNFNKRVSGVTATVRRLVPYQATGISLTVVGDQVDDLPGYCSFFDLLKRLFAKGKSPTVWHARRNTEMLMAIVLKRVFRRPLRLLFTSAAQRQHSGYTKWLIRQMDQVVAPCQASANYLDVPYTVIHHGIDLAEFKFQKRQEQDTVTLAQVGRVRPQKGSDLLIRAVIPLLKKHPELRVLMVGLITPEHKKFASRLKLKLHDEGVEHQVEWLSDLPWPELKRLYSSVDILVACPRNEGFGLTPLEAMASGAAVVVSDAGAFAEMVEDGVSGRLVAVDDHRALRGAIESMVSIPDLRARSANAAYERVQKRFTIQREAKALVDIYHALLGS